MKRDSRMKLYANGCSFVQGLELVDNNALNIANMKTAFPALIGAHNDAWGGSSNQAIANRTLEYCNRIKPDIAIIGWSAYTRVNAFQRFHDRKDRLGQTTIKHSSHPIEFDSFFNNIEVLYMQSKNLIEGTYMILSSMRVRPVFFFSFNDVVKVDVPTLWNNKCWNDAYFESTNKSVKNRKHQHPDQEQHNWLAEYLKKYLEI